MPNELNDLLDKLDRLAKKQALFQQEIVELQEEIYKLKFANKAEMPSIEKEPIVEKALEKEAPIQITKPIEPPIPEKQTIVPPKPQAPKAKSDIEKFIGENLINKIGILILVIGVAIGAKYAIDNELISPLTRIILGYVVGAGLVAFAIKLKKDYLDLSAVLLSGAMAIMYFITFAAYAFYQLIPQAATFALMVLFTIFTVIAALNYQKQVIAHIGLVGAYAVPFLLSDGSGNVLVLFTYMSIINVGILAIAVKQYWKPLYFVAFLLSWVIFLAWFTGSYKVEVHFQLACIFLSVFFAIFYAVFLVYKLIQKEMFHASDIFMLLLNSFLFYGIGYVLLMGHEMGKELLGLFTLGNAIIHFGVSLVIYQQKLADKNLFYLVAGLVLTFITIAIPVQLEGHWVVLLWSVEAALLFWIGRTKDVPFYEKLSYIMMALSAYCLAFNWMNHYNIDTTYHYGYSDLKALTPILNTQFLCSVVFIASFAFINYLNRSKAYLGTPEKWAEPIIKFCIPGLLLIAIYLAFHLEIANYFNQAYNSSVVKIQTENGLEEFWNDDLHSFGKLSLINYALFFFSLLGLINMLIFKNRGLGLLNIALCTYIIVLFLVQGLPALSDLRTSYLSQDKYFQHGSLNIAIRYISYIFVGLSLTTIYKYLQQTFMQALDKRLSVVYDALLFGSVLWMASTELITWIEVSGSSNSYKLGLSIFWGIYALLLIVLGIAKKKKHLRLGGIALFAITLAKLFFYDLDNLNTIAKTVIFISLGVLLLLISFLYNKYKHLIADDDE